MLQSMTGFGEAQCEDGGHVYHVEIRSVNNRYFKASVHLPDACAFLEPELEQALRRRLTRGTVTLRAYLRDLTPDAAQQINHAALQSYLRQLRAAAGADPAVTIDLATLAALPGVCQPAEHSQAQRDNLTRRLSELTEEALQRLIAMRELEGRGVVEDLRASLARVRAHLDAIRPRARAMVAEYRRRLLARVQELLAGTTVQLGADDLLKEVAIYAERCDISEELSRLGSHVGQFDEMLGSGEPAGRKLDFIAQEMLREANTIGSKSSDAEIARAVIEVKSAIDRIKEQVQNVE
jgi:uncharacterized protein (TIGR00255 family)